MKIKWTDKKKEIPKIGILNTGDVREVPEDLGKGFIKQGQAKKFVEKKLKGGDE